MASDAKKERTPPTWTSGASPDWVRRYTYVGNGWWVWAHVRVQPDDGKRSAYRHEGAR